MIPSLNFFFNSDSLLPKTCIIANFPESCVLLPVTREVPPFLLLCVLQPFKSPGYLKPSCQCAVSLQVCRSQSRWSEARGKSVPAAHSGIIVGYEVTRACVLLELDLRKARGSLIYSWNHLFDRHHRDLNSILSLREEKLHSLVETVLTLESGLGFEPTYLRGCSFGKPPTNICKPLGRHL